MIGVWRATGSIPLSTSTNGNGSGRTPSPDGVWPQRASGVRLPSALLAGVQDNERVACMHLLYARIPLGATEKK